MVIAVVGILVKFFYKDFVCVIKGYYHKVSIEKYVKNKYGNEFKVVDYRPLGSLILSGYRPTIVLFSNGKIHFQVYLLGDAISDFHELGKRNYEITQKFLSELSLPDDVFIELAYASDGHIDSYGFDHKYMGYKIYTPDENDIYDMLSLHIFINPEGQFNPQDYYSLYDEVYLKASSYPIGWITFHLVDKKVDNITDLMSVTIPEYDNNIFRKASKRDRIGLLEHPARTTDGKITYSGKKKLSKENFCRIIDNLPHVTNIWEYY